MGKKWGRGWKGLRERERNGRGRKSEKGRREGRVNRTERGICLIGFWERGTVAPIDT